MNYDVQQTTDDKFVIWIIIDHEKQAKGWQKHPLDQTFQDGSQEHTTAWPNQTCVKQFSSLCLVKFEVIFYFGHM